MTIRYYFVIIGEEVTLTKKKGRNQKMDPKMATPQEESDKNQGGNNLDDTQEIIMEGKENCNDSVCDDSDQENLGQEAQSGVDFLKRLFLITILAIMALIILLVVSWTIGTVLSVFITQPQEVEKQSDELRALPGTYYLKTLAGFEFSNQPKRHPLFGARFLPVTQAVQKEYNEWLETGLLIVPPIPGNKLYYDPGTGAPVAWGVIRKVTDSQPEMRVSPLPGYDPMTSKILKVIDENLAENFEPLPLECFAQNKGKSLEPYFLLKTSPGELSLCDTSVVIEKAAQVNVYNR